jgi:hypothetical protein
MNKPLDIFCDHLDGMLERQQLMLSLCVAQGHAAKAKDVAYLEAKTAAIHALAEDIALAEKQRVLLNADLARALGLTEDQPSLRNLLPHLPEIHQRRLREVHREMRILMVAIRRSILSNNRTIRRSLAVVNAIVRGLPQNKESHSGAYSGRGENEQCAGLQPAMLDHCG